MRDAEGIFLGHHVCSRYGGLSSYYIRECCGGRKVKSARVVCLLNGIVEAEQKCNAKCWHFAPKK